MHSVNAESNTWMKLLRGIVCCCFGHLSIVHCLTIGCDESCRQGTGHTEPVGQNARFPACALHLPATEEPCLLQAPGTHQELDIQPDMQRCTSAPSCSATPDRGKLLGNRHSSMFSLQRCFFFHHQPGVRDLDNSSELSGKGSS